MSPLSGITSIGTYFLYNCSGLASVNMWGIAYDKMAASSYSFNLGTANTGCTVTVSDNPANWTSKFASRSAYVDFTN
jgi:hypothetical protein